MLDNPQSVKNKVAKNKMEAMPADAAIFVRRAIPNPIQAAAFIPVKINHAFGQARKTNNGPTATTMNDNNFNRISGMEIFRNAPGKPGR
jgi:hypothetical protein